MPEPGMPTRSAAPRKRGEAARVAIRTAAAGLLEQVGYRALTLDDVAAAARVSKATIYRHWPTKAALAISVLLDRAGAQLTFPDTGSVRGDLHQLLAGLVRTMADPRDGGLLAALIADAQLDPRTAETIRTDLLAGRRADAREALRRGSVRGELRPDLDVETTIDSLVGPVYFRLLAGHAPLDTAFADALIENVMRGIHSSTADGIGYDA
ncbi:TetR/AcrR family transcriptional regulator [Dactylosporangium sp. CA-092794]|uniref:TetR/AcrR family transcriptional regulator n=1 Tax=Dactylosporangium sp. CA-092794 TaxID=3239929 RepID=UPI003D93615E